jgi:hypothetical protein
MQSFSQFERENLKSQQKESHSRCELSDSALKSHSGNGSRRSVTTGMGKSKNRDIRNLSAVLGSAIICSGLLAAFFIHYYGPSGHYLAGQAILDPTILEKKNYQERLPNTGQKVHFIFDQMEFFYYDPQKDQMDKKVIPLKNYQKFYDLIASEKSLSEVSEKIENLFLTSHPTILTARMRTRQDSSNVMTKIYQVVQFVQEDYFRVQLQERSEQEWVYFYQPHLYRDVMQLFTYVNL